MPIKQNTTLMTNKEFRDRVMTKLAREANIPVSLLTVRQAMKFRNKRGQFYRLWKQQRPSQSD